jgi:signal transduction histidine kinase
MGMAGDARPAFPASRLAMTIALFATGLQGPTYAHMVLAYPTGRLRERRERIFIVVAYMAGIGWMLPPALFVDPRTCGNCGPGVPSLLFTGHTFDITPIGRVFWSIFIALGIVFIALIVRRISHSPPGARRTLLPLALAAVFAAAHFMAERIGWFTNWSQAQPVFDWLDRIDVLVLPVAIFFGLETIRRHRGPLGDFVVELGTAGTDDVRAKLALAIGDPTLELALWLPDEQRFVDEAGAPVSVESPQAGRAVTLIGPERQPLAALIHDSSLVGQQPLLEAAGAAARLALENARLHAELRAQLSELQRSRARIVVAGDEERRRVERDLHDGAQQRLLALGLALQLMGDNGGDRELLADAQAELQAALHELRELARGIHPAVLNDRGLAAAIAGLADRAQIPVRSEVSDERYPQPVESAAYFVVSEALANVTKHACAQSASVTVAEHAGVLTVEVSDDGRGGANPLGGGLTGLADRVGALGGELAVDSTGQGTKVTARIPCVSSLQTTQR